ncbi:MAG TPA: hypothetical protein VJN18_20445 [Polyangiaceae bacterium]|nr:hypothetical protein [Polyangiaceae bacterium]
MARKVGVGKSVLASLGVATAACGGWINLESPDDDASGASPNAAAAGGAASAGRAAAASTGAASSAVGGGADGNEAPGVTGGVGSTGAAGDSSGSLDDRFIVIPGSLTAGEDPNDFATFAARVSDDGRLVLGGTIDISGNDFCQRARCVTYLGDGRLFSWTRETGSQPWAGVGVEAACLSADGSVVFAPKAVVSGNYEGFARWTQSGGFANISGRSDYPASSFWSCSSDGRAAGGNYWPGAVSAFPSPVLWKADRWDGQAIPVTSTLQIPGAKVAWVLSDGLVLIIAQAPGPPYSNEDVYRIEGDAEPVKLPHPPGSACRLVLMRGLPTSILFWNCGTQSPFTIYRWSAATDQFLPVGEDSGRWYGISDDGSAVLSVADDSFTYWKDNESVVIDIAPETVQPLGLSSDGHIVYFNLVENDGSPSARSTAMRWTPSGGFEPLGALPGLAWTELVPPYSNHERPRFPEGLAVGSAAPSYPRALGYTDSTQMRAVLWDALGARDIAAELEAAGVDLQGLKLRAAERVFAGSPIRVMGWAQLPSGAERAFIAALPTRN